MKAWDKSQDKNMFSWRPPDVDKAFIPYVIGISTVLLALPQIISDTVPDNIRTISLYIWPLNHFYSTGFSRNGVSQNMNDKVTITYAVVAVLSYIYAAYRINSQINYKGIKVSVSVFISDIKAMIFFSFLIALSVLISVVPDSDVFSKGFAAEIFAVGICISGFFYCLAEVISSRISNYRSKYNKDDD